MPNVFFFPALETLATKKIVITSRYGGQLDFLTPDNSLLVDGKIIRAPRSAHYWTSSPYSEMFEPDIDDAVNKLQYCINNYDEVKAKIEENITEDLFNKYSWDNIAKEIIGLCE